MRLLPTQNKKVVLDVNVFIAFIIFDSKIVQKIINNYRNGNIQLFYSSSLEKELVTKLRYFEVQEEIIDYWVNELKVHAYKIRTTVSVNTSRDKNDNYLLEIIQSIDADFLITRDKDLLSLNSFQLWGNWDSTIIITPETFVQNYLF